MFSGFVWNLEMLLRLLLAVAAGSIVGIERETRGRPAGLRTHILVTLGAAILSVASLQLGEVVNVFGSDLNVRVDVSRIASGMITGIGFLGAGTIIKTGTTVRGLTTAASLWCVACIGMGFGFGFYTLSIVGSILMMFTLMVINKIERGISKNIYKMITVVIKGTSDRVDELRQIFIARGWGVMDTAWKKNKTTKKFIVKYEVRFNMKKNVREAAAILDELDFVESYKVS